MSSVCGRDCICDERREQDEHCMLNEYIVECIGK